MAKNIIHYIEEYGDYTFGERPLNDVDSLVLCQFSYFRFDGMIPLVTENKKSVSLRQLAENEHFDDLFQDDLFEKDNRALFEAMLKSKRYRTLKMNCYINIIEKEWETQFSAITFILEDGSIYLAYRGTDVTIVGWKEDFNMAFMDPVPGQEYSVKYINMVTGRWNNAFYVGGHSKGGNLAVYAAMNCKEAVRNRILKIYSMDGPGFRPEVLKRCPYDEVKDRIVKILPHSSLVGMLFEWDNQYQVVESRSLGLLQHNTYFWLIEEDHFVYAKQIYEGRRLMDNTINEWVLSLTQEEVKTFVDTLFDVVSATEADNIIQIAANWKKSSSLMKAAIKDVDEETSQMLKKVIKSLFVLLRIRVKQSMKRGERRLKGVPDATEPQE